MSGGLDTIAAVATPPGRGGIGVVRISGAFAEKIATAICGGVPPERTAKVCTFRDGAGATIDHGLALYFGAPRSFTGEDVLELHAHGSPIVLDALVRRACELGARPARAGEFSERAFLNGKLDLTRAEAIADLIAARSEAQARAALRSLDGEFARQVAALVRAVVRLRVEVEAGIDFADDPSEASAPAAIRRLGDATLVRHAELLAAARRGVRLNDGLRVVIAGAPNVGKSSLLNALAGRDRAIVTDLPGTTRDVLRETVLLDGAEVGLADTAGLREAGDAIEGEGIRRARAELAQADLVLWVVDARANADRAGFGGDAPAAPRIVVRNKIDLAGEPPRRSEHDGAVTIALSARTGEGLDLLRAELRRAALTGAGEGDFSARSRHVRALERAGNHLQDARGLIAAAAGVELVAEELRAAQRALDEITGEFTSEDLLGAIFASFCVGK